MKRGLFKHHTVEIPLYFGSLHVLIGHDLNAVNTAAGFEGGELNGRSYNGFEALVFEGEKNGVTAYFGLFRPDAAPTAVAHEALHLTNYIMRGRGVKWDDQNDEPYAYLLGWVVGQIHYALTSKEIKAQKTITL